MKPIQHLIGLEVEVIHHAGNIRTCMFGRLSFDSKSKWFTVLGANGSNIRFGEESVLKIDSGKFHNVIYI